MSIWLSSDHQVALVDSVNETAFGPTFRSREHAHSFLKWYQETREHEVGFAEDLRTLTPRELLRLVSRWNDECCDPATEELLDEARA